MDRLITVNINVYLLSNRMVEKERKISVEFINASASAMVNADFSYTKSEKPLN
jgi:hypothetical protein